MYQLRDYQQQAVDSVWRFLCNRKGNPVVVLPTGAGKSLVIAELARQAAENNLGVLVVAHRKELLEQNAEKIRSLLPGVSVGIYSAGLKSRDTEDQVILAGIQSVYKRAFEFGARHLVIVDEAHLIPDSDTGIYRQFLDDLRVSCPQHRVVGLTATPYRLDSGMIYGGGSMFDDVAIDVAVGDLIDQGYLSPITSQPVTEIDTSGLHHRAGEFVKSEMESLFERSVIDACKETVEIANATGRKSVIVFACGVQHASHVREIIESFGESAACVTGETLPLIRESILADFKAGRLRFLVNVDVLTTGFDAPNIDCIAVMRATESAGLFAQIVGRGLRLSPGKSECVVLDFGENIKRHGAIDSKDYGKRSKKKGTGTGDGPVKSCPACDELVPAGTRECGCGFRFPPPETRHDSEADKDSAILERQQKPQAWVVEGIRYSLHVKRDTGQRSMRVIYDCLPDSPDAGELERQSISEWVCLEHAGFPRRMAERWWHERAKGPIPLDVEDGLEIARAGGLADTRAIKTKKDGKYFRIVDYTLGEIPDEVFEPVEEFEDEPF